MGSRVETFMIAGSVLLLTGQSFAQCTSTKDASLLQRSTRSAVACNYRRLRQGPTATCHPVTPPPCSGTLASDAVALAFGANNPPAAAVDRVALRAQLTCQNAIGTAVASFVGTKLRYLIRGLTPADAETKARRGIDRIPKRCTLNVLQDVSGMILPDVGKQCDAAVGAPGTAVDTASLDGALVTLLETWVDRVGPNPAPLRPNILFILTDDQRFDTIGLTHSIDGVTPVMPTIASEIVNKGVTFQNSYVTTDLCAPSRSSLLAAKYSHTTGVHDNGGTDGGFAAFNDASTLPVWLKAAGYHTGIYGKYINGYASAAPYQAPGWDEWHVFKDVAYFNYTLVENGAQNAFGSADTDYSTDVLCAKAVQFIHDSAGGPPFFLYFAPKAPHAPATPARHRQAGVGAGDRVLGRDQAGEHRRVRSAPARDAAGGGRGGRRAHPGAPRHRSGRQYDDRVRLRQRLLLGLAPLGAEAVSVRGVHACPARDSLRAARAAAAGRDRRRPEHRPRGDDRRARRRDRRSRSRGDEPPPSARRDGAELAHRLPRGALGLDAGRRDRRRLDPDLRRGTRPAVEVQRVRHQRERALRRDGRSVRAVERGDGPGERERGDEHGGAAASAPARVAVAVGRVAPSVTCPGG